jgi:glutamyl-tRNA reductase
MNDTMIANCFVFGVNHHSTETDIRGQFSLSPQNQELLYQKASQADIKSLAIVNTCNRTEIVGMGDLNQALDLYFTVNNLAPELKDKIFIKNGKQAVEHLFNVASGLDSKVIGDLEILGQVKDAFHQSKKYGLLNGYLERMANNCVQAAKEIRHNTQISNGTTSLAYSVVKFFKGVQLNHQPKILLIGAGSFGKHIGQNITDYMHQAELYITNRTDSRAEELASHFGAKQLNFTDWKSQLNQFDIIISAVSAPDNYLINEDDVAQFKHTYLLDMSVPYSINPSIKNHLGAQHLTIDELSQMVNNTIESRKSEIPIAKEILDKNLQLFYEWSNFYQNSDSLKNWKKSLYEKVAKCPFLSKLPTETVDKHVNKSMSQFALYIKNNNQIPQDTTHMLNDFLTIYHEAEIAQHAQSKSH